MCNFQADKYIYLIDPVQISLGTDLDGNNHLDLVVLCPTFWFLLANKPSNSPTLLHSTTDSYILKNLLKWQIYVWSLNWVCSSSVWGSSVYSLSHTLVSAAVTGLSLCSYWFFLLALYVISQRQNSQWERTVFVSLHCEVLPGILQLKLQHDWILENVW